MMCSKPGLSPVFLPQPPTIKVNSNDEFSFAVKVFLDKSEVDIVAKFRLSMTRSLKKERPPTPHPQTHPVPRRPKTVPDTGVKNALKSPKTKSMSKRVSMNSKTSVLSSQRQEQLDTQKPLNSAKKPI